MIYDLKLLHDYCHELGYVSSICVEDSQEELKIELKKSCVLIFRNYQNSDGFKDCLIAFDSDGKVNWHMHGDPLMFSNGHDYVQIDCLELLSGLKEGIILVCDTWKNGQLHDRALIHHEFHDFFETMEMDEEFSVYRG
jgi:hypothetical protein